MELKLTKNPLKIELNLSQFRAKTEVECVELYSDSVGNQWGIYLELVWNWLANPMFSFWTVWGMHRGCWGRSGESIRDYYDCFGKQFIFVVAAGECIGNLSGILTNYWETVGIHRDPWRICGDFWLRIHSLGEVQIQTEHIHTHAISLTKPRFPFHVLTGLARGLLTGSAGDSRWTFHVLCFLVGRRSRVSGEGVWGRGLVGIGAGR